MTEVIKTINLTKNYGSLCAVDNLNLAVGKGEILGFLGLNGAGKTTTIRMLLGMVSPSSGSCYLKGEKIGPRNTEIWNDVGYLVETTYSYPDLTVRENLELVHKLRNIQDASSVAWIINKLKLEAYAEVKSKNLSLGNAQRLAIAKAIIHKPKILLLDEPTNGLDPAGIVEIRKLLSDLAQNLGVTMIISSHKLEEIAKLATNIAIIHHGQLVKNIKAQDLENQLHKSLLVDGKNPKRISTILKGAGYKINQLKKDNKNTPLEILDREAIKNPERIATILVNSGEPPTFLKVQKEDLETYFIRTITKSEGEDL